MQNPTIKLDNLTSVTGTPDSMKIFYIASLITEP
jgi:hypothetical protein